MQPDNRPSSVQEAVAWAKWVSGNYIARKRKDIPENIEMLLPTGMKLSEQDLLEFKLEMNIERIHSSFRK